MAAVVEVITVSSTIFPQPLRLEFKRPGRHFFFSNMQNGRDNEFPPRLAPSSYDGEGTKK